MADISKIKVNATTYDIKDETARNGLITKVLYYDTQGVNVGTSTQIMRIPSSGTDSNITPDTVLISLQPADPANMDMEVSWTSYTGYMTIVGTCTAATTADVVLGEKGN